MSGVDASTVYPRKPDTAATNTVATGIAEPGTVALLRSFAEADPLCGPVVEALLTEDVVALETLIERQSPLLEVWVHLARRTLLPRPPRHLDPRTRNAFLGHLVQSLRCKPEQFGAPAGTAYRMALLVGSVDAWPQELPQLPSEELTPELFGATVQAALRYVQTVPSEARNLCALAAALVQEFQRRGVRGRQLRALRAQTLTVEAVRLGLDGEADAARQQLLEAESLLRTRERLRDWVSLEGELTPPAAPHMPFQAHALWLHGRGMLEAVSGFVDTAVTCWHQARRLYLSAGAYFGAGTVSDLIADAYRWQARPVAALAELEKALQLLDLRGQPLLAAGLVCDLASLYALATEPDRAAVELEALRETLPHDALQLRRARALLAFARGALEPALDALNTLRRESADPRLSLWLCLDLAELETRRGEQQRGAGWLEVGRPLLGQRSTALLDLWQSVATGGTTGGATGGETIPVLRGALLRDLAFPGCTWRPERRGSLLDEAKP